MPATVKLDDKKLEEIRNIECPKEYPSMDRRTFHEKLYGVVVTGDADKARKVVVPEDKSFLEKTVSK